MDFITRLEEEKSRREAIKILKEINKDKLYELINIESDKLATSCLKKLKTNNFSFDNNDNVVNTQHYNININLTSIEDIRSIRSIAKNTNPNDIDPFYIVGGLVKKELNKLMNEKFKISKIYVERISTVIDDGIVVCVDIYQN